MDQTAEACRWMRVEKGLSVRDIANRLNITEGAVRKALSRAGATAQQVHRSNSPRGPVNPIILDTPRDPCPCCGARGDYDCGCKRRRR